MVGQIKLFLKQEMRIVMLTSKQRSFLRSLAHEVEPSVFLGKSGLTQNVIDEIDINLEKRELVKVKLQDGCELTPKDVANQIGGTLGAEFVQAIGRKFTLYRESKDFKKIELPRTPKPSKSPRPQKPTKERK